MIKIKGHSNFNVTIKTINNNKVISKCSNYSEKNRLKNQIEKQIKIYENNIFENVKIPKVLYYYEYEDSVEYIMEYVDYSINIVDFLSKYNHIQIDWFIKKIINIIETYINNCNYQLIDKKILDLKIKNIKLNIVNNKLLNINNKLLNINNNKIKKIINYLENNINEIIKIKYPIGICHGDLTLSNILIDVDNMDLYLIDFLDSFIDNSLLDIIKIRQDTKYYWILNLCKFKYDENKIILILNYIDEKINSHFSKYNFYNKGYKYFQIMNFLRILQHSKEKSIVDYLLLNLDNLMT